MNGMVRLAALLLLSCLALGCSSMTVKANGPPAATQPAKARVYFALDQGYPSGRAYITEGETLLGYVTNNEHFYVDVDAGKHLFVMISEQDEAIEAELEPGKTYYVRVFITPGVMSTRTYWVPLKNSGEDVAASKEIIGETTRVELIAEKAKSWEQDEAEDLKERVASFQSGEDEAIHKMGAEHAY